MPDIRRFWPAIQASLSNLLRFRPVRQGQTLRGYRVFPGRNPTLLVRAGLRVGDIITSANGVPLTSADYPQALVDPLQRHVVFSGEFGLVVAGEVSPHSTIALIYIESMPFGEIDVLTTM